VCSEGLAWDRSRIGAAIARASARLWLIILLMADPIERRVLIRLFHYNS